MDADPVARHYSLSGLGETILSALEALGKNIDALEPHDLAPVDEFHMRGREATESLAGAARPEAAWHVLDVGSGLGGTGRFLSSTYGCRVTGIDLTEEYCTVASMLSERTGLANRTAFLTGSALSLPFENGTFDASWTEHVQMNIDDKTTFYREMARVLKPGGKLIFHDIFQGPGGTPHYPVPWANDPSISHLIPADDAAGILDSLGLDRLSWKETSGEALRWFGATLERIREHGPPPLGIHMLMGGNAPDKLRNIHRNLEEGRVVAIEGVYRCREWK